MIHVNLAAIAEAGAIPLGIPPVGSIRWMARSKATLTVDRHKVHAAMELTGQATMSDVVDLALDRLIRAGRLQRDMAAYRRTPMTSDEMTTAGLPVRLDLGDEDTDYDALYGSE
jgi:hypothetical protein